MRVCPRCGRPIALPRASLRSAKEIRQDRASPRCTCYAQRSIYGGSFAEGYCVANDEEQAQGRVFQAVRSIVEKSPLLLREARVTQYRIEFPATGASIVAIASDYAGAAGANPTIICFDELWGYTSERSRRLWDEMVPSPARKISCRFTSTYAGF